MESWGLIFQPSTASKIRTEADLLIAPTHAIIQQATDRKQRTFYGGERAPSFSILHTVSLGSQRDRDGKTLQAESFNYAQGKLQDEAQDSGIYAGELCGVWPFGMRPSGVTVPKGCFCLPVPPVPSTPQQ
jgi:hypothetical protein